MIKNIKIAFGILAITVFFLALITPIQSLAYGVIGQALVASGFYPGAGLQNPYVNNSINSYKYHGNVVQNNLIAPQYQGIYPLQPYYPVQTYYATSWTCSMGYYTAACQSY